MLVRVVVASPAVLLFAAAMVYPLGALVVQCLAEEMPPAAGWGLASRPLRLLGRAALLAGAGSALGLVLSLPAAYVVGRSERAPTSIVVRVAMLACLLSPPMIHAFGWGKLLPSWFGSSARCVMVWVLWAWPIPAVLLGAGWSRTGRAPFEAARLEATSVRSFLHVGLPLLAPYLTLAAGVPFVLFLSDYGVPHACGLQVHATELLAWAGSSLHAIDTVAPALPAAFLILASVLGLARPVRRAVHDVRPGAFVSSSGARTGGVIAVAFGYFLLCWVAPIAALWPHLKPPGMMTLAIRNHGVDLIRSLLVGAAAGGASLLMGGGMVAWKRFARPALVWAVFVGALPGALLGKALIIGYNRAGLTWIYDHAWIVGLSHLARFGWIGMAAVFTARAMIPREWVLQARTDGASDWRILSSILPPIQAPILGAGAALVAILSVGEAAASALVRVPAYQPIALVIIEKFHRLEDGMMISLSFWLTAIGAIGGLLVVGLLHGRRRSLT